MKIKKESIIKFLVYIFVALYITLPDYFKIGGFSAYYIITFFALIFILLFGLKINKEKLRYFGKIIIPIILPMVIAYIYFGEINELVGYIISTFIATFVIFINVKDEKYEEKITDVICIVGFIISITGIIEKVSGFNIFSLIENIDLGPMGSSHYMRDGGIRIEQSFGSAITFAIFLTFINILSLYKIKNNKGKKYKRLFFIITYILTFYAVYATISRMPFIILVLTNLLIILKISNKNKIVYIIIAIFLIIIMDLAFNGIITSFIEKYTDLIQTLFGSSKEAFLGESSSGYRMELIPTLIPYIKQNFIFGYGNKIMEEFTFSLFGFTYYSIDNAFLSILMYHGIFGFLSYIIPIIYFIYFSIKRIYRKESFGYYYLIIIIGYILNLFSVAQMGEKRIFYVLLAILMSIEYNSKKNTKSKY